MTNETLPRCDKCDDCKWAHSKKYDGYTYWCKLNGRDVGQSHFGMNSPRCCPKRKLNKENRVMDTKKLYLLTDDYRIFYIDHMCTCDKCRERGETEIFIHGLDGSYVDCLKLNELNKNFKDNGMLTCGNSIDEIVKWIKDFVVDVKSKENKFYQELNRLLNKQMCGDNDKIDNTRNNIFKLTKIVDNESGSEGVVMSVKDFEYMKKFSDDLIKGKIEVKLIESDN